MDRLTEERGERTWTLFHVGWYINFGCVVVALLGAIYFLGQIWGGASAEAGTQEVDVGLMVGLVTIAAVLLMGAGVSRYQARLEGQHLELKMAITKIGTAVENLNKGGDKEE